MASPNSRQRECQFTRWNCGRCGYLALSSPYEDFKRGDGVEGTETHKCPKCCEQWWLDKDTYGRMKGGS